jgi:hypothetical protein
MESIVIHWTRQIKDVVKVEVELQVLTQGNSRCVKHIYVGAENDGDDDDDDDNEYHDDDDDNFEYHHKHIT